jgi:PAS domain S-box-containing protein
LFFTFRPQSRTMDRLYNNQIHFQGANVISQPGGAHDSSSVREPLRILLLEDDPNDAELIAIELLQGDVPHVSKCVCYKQAFLTALAEFRPDLILSDHKLPDFTGIDALVLAREHYPDLPFILVTGALGEELVVDTIKRGATDYILKHRLRELVPAVLRAVREAEQRRQRRQAEELIQVRNQQLTIQNEQLQRVQHQLEASRERYATLYHSAPTGYTTLDEQGIIHEINSTAADMLGKERTRLIGRPFHQFVSPSGQARLLAHLAACAKSAERVRTELTLVDNGGAGLIAELCSVANPNQERQPKLYHTTIADITQRKQTEAILRESEQRFRQLAESIREVFWMTDLSKSRMIYVSPGYEEIWGRSCQSLYDAPRAWLEAIHPEDRERVLEAAMTRQAAGNYNEQYRIVRPDGTVRWVQDRAFPVRNESGEIYRIAGIAEDITDQKQAEQRLAARNSVIRGLAESATLAEAATRILQSMCESLEWELGALWQLDRATATIRCVEVWFPPEINYEEFARSTRGQSFSRDEGLPGRVWTAGKPVWISDVSADSKLVRGEIASRLGLHSAFAFPILLKQETIGVVEFFSRRIQQPDDPLLDMVAGLGSQIGQFMGRKEAEALSSTLAHAVASTSEMICITDLENRFIFVNHAFLRTYGYEEAEVVGKTPDIVFSAKNPPGLMNEILAGSRGDGWRGEVLDRRKDGTEFPIFLSTSQIKDQTGRVIGLLGVAQDVTERKKAEKRAASFSLLGYQLSGATRPQEAANIILDVAADLFGWDAAYLHLYSQAEDRIIPVLTIDTIDGQRTSVAEGSFTLDPSPLMRRIMQKGSLLMNRSEKSDIEPVLVPFGQTTALSASKMYVPVRSGGAVLGVLSIQSYTPNRYSQQDLLLLESLAGRCGDALQRIKVTEALGQAEAKYRSIFENATEGIFQTTPDGRYLSANMALAQMFGYQSPAELISQVTNIEHQTYVRKEARTELKRLLETQGVVKGFEAERYRKDGAKFWMSINGHVVRDSTGAVLYYEGTNQDITARKRAEEQIQLLADALQSTHELVSVTDSENRFTFLNRAFLQTCGYRQEEMLGKTPDFLYSPKNPPGLCRQVFEQTMAGGWTGEIINCRKNGTEFPILLRTSLIKNRDGEPIGLMGVATDISERKRAEKETVAFSGLGYRLSAASSPEQAARIILEVASELFGWDAGYVHLYSPTEDKVTPVLTVDTIHGEQQAIASFGDPGPLTRLVLKEGPRLFNRTAKEPLPVPTRPFGDVNRPSASLMLVPIHASGATVGFLSIQSYTPQAYSHDDLMLLQAMADYCGDALRRIEVAAALRDSERNLRLIAENTTDVIFAYDMQRRPVYVNLAVKELTGYTFDEIREHGFIDWVHPHDRDRMLKHWNDLYEGKSHSGVEFRIITKTGEEKWCSGTWGPLFDESGCQIGVQGREQDISERKQLEQEVLEASANERRRIGHELHDGLGQYLAGIAYRTKALEQILAGEGIRHAPEAKELAGLISNAISQTRSLARGLDPVEVETIGLPAALQNLAADTEKFFNTVCKFNCVDSAFELEGQSALALYRITQEAIHNATTHGQARQIDISLDCDARNLHLTIQDDGLGFNPHGQNPTGMGLRVMQYRARSIGGTLRIVSEPQKGAKVFCSAPKIICGDLPSAAATPA